MIRVSVFYPNSPSIKFDMAYYLEKHMTLVERKLGAALKGMTVEQGIAGGSPDAPITFAVIAHLTFDSVDAFQAAFEPHATEIMADISKYSNLQPIFQVSQVKL
jgi:uncharacterized protein (TIGR02118 family)